MGARGKWPVMDDPLVVRVHDLSEEGAPSTAVPFRWHTFGKRWREWRRGYDRRHWPDSWQGRCYHQGSLIFPSPWDPVSQLSTRLSVRNGLAFCYVLQAGNQRALLLPGFLGAGHELEALYLIDERVLLHLPCSLATAEWFFSLLGGFLPLLAGRHLPDAVDPARPVRLRLEGHPNFAHQLLNGYTAIEAALAAEGEKLGEIQSLGLAPFVPMEQIFPEVCWLEPLQAQEPMGLCFELPISQRPERINPSLRRRVRRACRDRISEKGQVMVRQLDQWRKNGGWVLWLSIKSKVATAEGLSELAVLWLIEQKRRGISLPLLLLDGFSLQAGQRNSDRIYGAEISTLTADELEMAQEIQHRLASRHLAIPVVLAVGLPLADSVVLGERTDFYFCHQGTVQHKIGWLQEGIPGVVHSNNQRNQGGSHPWGSMGVGEPPQWLPATLSSDLEGGSRASYRFLPEKMEDGARWLCDQLEGSLPDRFTRMAST
jgi:hypothetical protein